MKRVIYFLAFYFLMSCDQAKETVSEVFSETKDKIQQTANEKIKGSIDKKISESINSLTKSESVPFTEVFPEATPDLIKEFNGRKFKLPNGSAAYMFQYKADKNEMITFLENQKTTDESRSESKAKKIDGQDIIKKLSFVEKFIPDNLFNTSVIDSLENNHMIEYYKIKRYPNSSTIIYNPKNQKVYQFVELQK